MKSKNIKIYFLFLYIVLAVIVVYFIRPIYLVSILLILGPPSLINFFWLKKSRIKVLVFSLLTTILFAPTVELMCRLVNAWDVASVLYRPFGYIPLENMLFAFFNIFWVLSFYEYFIDHDTNKNISKHFKILVCFYILFATLVFGLFFYKQNIIGMHYYLISVPILILPALFIFFRYPKILKKTVLPTLFFAAVFFIYEIVSMRIGYWWWPGTYLYSFNLSGMVFPLDDIINWYLLSTPTLIGAYEVFADDIQ